MKQSLSTVFVHRWENFSTFQDQVGFSTLADLPSVEHVRAGQDNLRKLAGYVPHSSALPSCATARFRGRLFTNCQQIARDDQ